MGLFEKIKKIENLGIFSEYRANASLNDFNRYNLIYGWNASGKSTLVKLFHAIEKKILPADFSSVEFEIGVRNHLPITHLNYSSSSINIRVFNQDFIKENIEWDKSAKSILLISEEKIGEGKRLAELNAGLVKKRGEHEQMSALYNQKTNEKNGFLSTTARLIKEAFKIIDTSDRYYFNYDKRKLEDLISCESDRLKAAGSILSDKEIEILRLSIKPVPKANIDFSLSTINAQEFVGLKTRVTELLASNLYTQSIERLKSHSDIQEWVKQGIDIHKKHDSTNCEYCGQVFPPERKEQLAKHFSKDYALFMEKLDGLIGELSAKKFVIGELPESSSFYEEFQSDYSAAKKSLAARAAILNNLVAGWTGKLSKKKQNPFDKPVPEESNIEAEIALLNEVISKISSLVLKHNQKNKNFDQQIKELKQKLEMHYAAIAIKEKDYFGLVKEITDLEGEIALLAVRIGELIKSIEDIEKELSNEVLGSVKFNELLHDFLGRDDISLQFVPNEKGYRIIRKGSMDMAKNLSEGEKTAIAFMYFITKLKENDNKIEECIILVDDPISSFDTNHLFNAYSFLTKNCQSAKQLIIFTHNYWYFKLIRDWLLKGGRHKCSAFFTLENSIHDGNRVASMHNANNTLLEYHSEYHFLFSTLYRYRDKTTIDFETAYSLGNVARRLLESFLSFKYPKPKDLRAQIDNTGIDELKRDRIYWFIQKYSHSDRIEAHENIPDNLFGEGRNIISDVLSLIEEVDKVHYDQLIAVCKN